MSVLMPNYEIMGRGNPPASLADFQGLRVNASGGHAALMQALGSITTTIPAPDLYSSMERGALDSVVYPYTYAFNAYSLHELSTWVSDYWNLGTVHCVLGANADAYNSLPPQYRELIEEAIPNAYAHQIADYERVDSVNEADYAERGMVRVPMPDDVKAALEAAVEPSWAAWVADMDGRGHPGQELLDLILSAAAAAVAE